MKISSVTRYADNMNLTARKSYLKDLLAKYITDDDLVLTDKEFLRLVADRINDDIQSEDKEN